MPLDYKFDVDFNGFLLTQAKAEIILEQLDPHPNIGMYESPFYLHQDLTGARILRERVRKPIVEHFREEYLDTHCSDGFVIGGGATQTRYDATLAASFNKPFWLQLVGTGITHRLCRASRFGPLTRPNCLTLLALNCGSTICLKMGLP